MKYIVLIILGIAHTICSLFIGLVINVIALIWTLKFKSYFPLVPYTFYNSPYSTNSFDEVFPVFNRPKRKQGKIVIKEYKTYLHYIWGIN